MGRRTKAEREHLTNTKGIGHINLNCILLRFIELITVFTIEFMVLKVHINQSLLINMCKIVLFKGEYHNYSFLYVIFKIKYKVYIAKAMPSTIKIK